MEEIKKDLSEAVLGERKFLHDMANHILVADGMANFVKRSLTKKEDPGLEKELEKLEKAIKAIRSLSEDLKARRSTLHTLSDKYKL